MSRSHISEIDLSRLSSIQSNELVLLKRTKHSTGILYRTSLTPSGIIGYELPVMHAIDYYENGTHEKEIDIEGTNVIIFLTDNMSTRLDVTPYFLLEKEDGTYAFCRQSEKRGSYFAEQVRVIIEGIKG